MEGHIFCLNYLTKVHSEKQTKMQLYFSKNIDSLLILNDF